MTTPAKSVEKTMDEAVRDFEVSVTVVKMHAPAATHELLDLMLAQYQSIATLAKLLAETPFDV